MTVSARNPVGAPTRATTCVSSITAALDEP